MTKPKFKIGDVVVLEFEGMFKIIKIQSITFFTTLGIFLYNESEITENLIKNLRLATPEEIKLYVK